jgi:hypothetical protein
MIYTFLNEARTIIALEPSPLPLDNLMESLPDEFTSTQVEDKYDETDDTMINIKTDVKSDISEKEESLMRGAPYKDRIHLMQKDELIALGDLIEDKSYERRIDLISLLIRKESIEIMSIIGLQDLSNKKENIINLIFNSRNHLYTFGELIHNNLIRQNNDNIVITELCLNLVNSIVEEKLIA